MIVRSLTLSQRERKKKIIIIILISVADGKARRMTTWITASSEGT